MVRPEVGHAAGAWQSTFINPQNFRLYFRSTSALLADLLLALLPLLLLPLLPQEALFTQYRIFHSDAHSQREW